MGNNDSPVPKWGMSLRWTLFHGIHLSGEIVVSVTRVYANVSVGGDGGGGSPTSMPASFWNMGIFC